MADGGDRRHVKHGESVLVFSAFAGRKGDVGARHQGVKAGNAALVDARLHHPKLGVLAHQVFGIGAEAGGNGHAFLVGAQLDAGNAAHFNAEHFNHGVVHFDAVGAVHQQGDFGAGIADILHQKPAAGEKGNQRNEPHHRGEHIGFAHAGGHGLGGGMGFIGHIGRGGR